jgi:hypothetical protein
MFPYSPATSGLSMQNVLDLELYWLPLHVPNFECGMTIEKVTDDNGTYYLHTISGEIPAPTDELIKQLGILEKVGVWSMAKPVNELAYMLAEYECFGKLSFDIDLGKAPGKGARKLTFSIEQKMLVPAEKFTVA